MSKNKYQKKAESTPPTATVQLQWPQPPRRARAIRSRSTAHARVVQRDGTWHLFVYDSDGRMVNTDNTGAGGWEIMYADAREKVGALRLWENTGNRLAWDWSEILQTFSGDNRL